MVSSNELEVLPPHARLQRLWQVKKKKTLFTPSDAVSLLAMFEGTDKIDALESLLLNVDVSEDGSVDRIAGAFSVGSRAYARSLLTENKKRRGARDERGKPKKYYHTKARSEENLALIELHDDSTTTSNQSQVLRATVREESLGITARQLHELLEREKDCAVDVIRATRAFILEHTAEDVARAAGLFSNAEERVVVIAGLLGKVYDVENVDDVLLRSQVKGNAKVKAAILRARLHLPPYPFSPIFGETSAKSVVYFVVDNTHASAEVVTTSQGERTSLLRACASELSKVLKFQLSRCNRSVRFNVVAACGPSGAAAFFSDAGPVEATAEAAEAASAFARTIRTVKSKKQIALVEVLRAISVNARGDACVAKLATLSPINNNNNNHHRSSTYDEDIKKSIRLEATLILHDSSVKVPETIAFFETHASLVKCISFRRVKKKLKTSAAARNQSRKRKRDAIDKRRARDYQEIYFALLLVSFGACLVVSIKGVPFSEIAALHPTTLVPSPKVFGLCKWATLGVGIVASYLCLAERRRDGDAILDLSFLHFCAFLLLLPVGLVLLKGGRLVGVALVVAIQLACVFTLLRRLAREDEDASRAEKLWVHAPLRESQRGGPFCFLLPFT